MCPCQICQTARQRGEYISPTYHHGEAEGFFRSKVCDCGFWTCGGRGCGDCPDCLDEHCECGLPDFGQDELEKVLRSLRSDLIYHSEALEGSPLSRAQVEAVIHTHNPNTFTAPQQDAFEYPLPENCWKCQRYLPIEVRTPPLGNCPHCGSVAVPF